MAFSTGHAGLFGARFTVCVEDQLDIARLPLSWYRCKALPPFQHSAYSGMLLVVNLSTSRTILSIGFGIMVFNMLPTLC